MFEKSTWFRGFSNPLFSGPNISKKNISGPGGLKKKLNKFQNRSIELLVGAFTPLRGACT